MPEILGVVQKKDVKDSGKQEELLSRSSMWLVKTPEATSYAVVLREIWGRGMAVCGSCWCHVSLCRQLL